MLQDKLSNDTLAILGAVIIALYSLHILGVDAKDIVLAVGGGLIGYLSRGTT